MYCVVFYIELYQFFYAVEDYTCISVANCFSFFVRGLQRRGETYIGDHLNPIYLCTNEPRFLFRLIKSRGGDISV